jgi:hypothetical protein
MADQRCTHLKAVAAVKQSRFPFSWLRWITSPCFCIGHDDPIKVLTRAQLHLECPRCGEDLGIVLKGQTFKARKPAKTLRLVRSNVPLARAEGSG